MEQVKAIQKIKAKKQLFKICQSVDIDIEEVKKQLAEDIEITPSEKLNTRTTYSETNCVQELINNFYIANEEQQSLILEIIILILEHSYRDVAGKKMSLKMLRKASFEVVDISTSKTNRSTINSIDSTKSYKRGKRASNASLAMPIPRTSIIKPIKGKKVLKTVNGLLNGICCKIQRIELFELNEYPANQSHKFTYYQPLSGSILKLITEEINNDTKHSDLVFRLLDVFIECKPKLDKHMLIEKTLAKNKKKQNEFIPVWHLVLELKDLQLLGDIVDRCFDLFNLDTHRYTYDGNRFRCASTGLTEICRRILNSEDNTLFDLISLLLNRGAGINIMNVEYVFDFKAKFRFCCISALHLCVREGQADLVQLLLENNAQVKLPLAYCYPQTFPNFHQKGLNSFTLPSRFGESINNFYGNEGCFKPSVTQAYEFNTCYQLIMKNAPKINKIEIVKTIDLALNRKQTKEVERITTLLEAKAKYGKPVVQNLS